MADEIAALLGNTDLMNFANTVQKSDPYGLVGQSIAAWEPNFSVMNPTERAIGSFGKSFLSGLLQNYGQQRASDQLNSVINILPQLKSDPYSISAPEGVDSNAFNILKGTQILKNEQEKALAAQESKKFNLDILAKYLGKEAEIKGEMAGYGTTDPSQNPNSPMYKVNKDKLDTLDTLRDKFNKLPEVTSFSQVNKAAQAMAGALKDKGGPSDLELVRYAIQMIEPGMAVREGEQQAVMKSGSIPDRWKGELNKSLENGTAISDTVREGLKRLASRAYNAQKSGYDKALTYHQGLAEGRGLLSDGQSISYLGAAPDASVVFGSNNNQEIPAQTYGQPIPTGEVTKSGKQIYILNGVKGVID